MGQRRFRAPEALRETWQEPRAAKVIPQPCLQVEGSTVKGQEDCLFLNVHAPFKAKDLPVMVFIYGGGFSEGSSYEMGLYDGHHVSARHQVGQTSEVLRVERNTVSRPESLFSISFGVNKDLNGQAT